MTAPATSGGGRPVLVTGGAGFIGSNLADRLARDGHEVLVYDALARPGVEANLAWLRARHPRRISAVVADIRDEDELNRAAAEAGWAELATRRGARLAVFRLPGIYGPGRSPIDRVCLVTSASVLASNT